MNAWRKIGPWLLLAAAMPLQAVTYTVNDAGSGPDSNPNDNTCSTATPANSSTCTLRAAITEANGKTGPHTIKFQSNVTKITLGFPLPTITSPMTLDGTNASNAASDGRVEIDGANVHGCISLTDVTTASNNKGATGSTVKNFVIRRCQGDGISLSGHGYTVTGNRVGTNPAADASSSAADQNSGNGITVSGTVPVPAAPPTLATLIATLPQGFGGVQALQASLQSALTVVANPTVISGNVVSGNNGIGIWLFGQSTVNTIVAGNIVGLSQNGLSKVPNGRGAGGAINKAGVRIGSTAWGNFIGPGNLISGNVGHGVALDAGTVLLPNFVAGNLIGIGSAPAEVGNGENGIYIDSNPKGAPGANPTSIAAIIGPGNAISDNDSAASSSDLDSQNDASGGIIITGNSNRVRVYGNVIGLATFPAGATPVGNIEFGNTGNGILVGTRNNDIRNNIILANGRHGILLRTSSATNNIVRGNYVGVSVPTGLSPLISLGNTGDGIHISNASSNSIGGPAPSDANIIAANGRNGIALRFGSTSSGWSNLLTRNRIYGNARGGSGIAIDLERTLNAPDPLDQLDNPGTNYANFDQHRPAICGGALDPPACAGAGSPVFDGAGTALQWTVTNRPNSSIRIEFFADAADGSDQVFLGEKVVSTDALGLPTGAGCSGGVCTGSIGGSIDTVGMRVVATSTDLFLTDVPPTSDNPPVPDTPANNTSEFSDAAIATRKLAITTPPPLPGGTTNQAYPSITFAATGGSGAYTSWTFDGGTPPPGLALAAGSGVLSGTPTAANTYNFSVQVTDSAGATANRAYSITIAAQPPLVITTPSPLPNGTVGTAYDLTFTAAGGNGAAGSWQIQSGDLPDGLVLASNGTLSGTPTQVGTFEFNVRTTDQQPTTAVKAFTLTVVPAPVPLAVTTASPLSDAQVNVNYDATFAAAGGSGIYVSWQVVSGALPTGMQLAAPTGALSGKPLAAGAYSFTVRVTDSANNNASKAFALTVDPPAPQPPAAPTFTASPNEIDFGEISIGRTAIANVVLTNRGTADVTPNIFAAAPVDGPFTTDPGTCSGALVPNASCTMMVTFTPPSNDGTEYIGSSTICRGPAIGGLCTPLIIGQPSRVLARLRFRGVGTGTLAQVGPTTIDFGTQPLGSIPTVAVTITNPTDGLLTFNPMLLLSNATQFSTPSQTCGIGQLGAGGSCTISFRFSPTVVGDNESMTRIAINGPGGARQDYDITLRGTGIDTAQPAALTPMALDFGEVNVGTPLQLPILVRNTAGTSLQVTGTAFGTDANVWGFTPPGGCNISNGISCALQYSFTPRAQGHYSVSSQINLVGTGVNAAAPISLSGTGVGSLVQAAPRVLEFGNVTVGQTGRGRVDITNTSVDALTRTFSSPLPFGFTTTCGGTIAAGASCAINYSIVPDGDMVGPIASEATLLFANGVSGNQETVTITLGAVAVDALFRDGFE